MFLKRFWIWMNRGISFHVCASRGKCWNAENLPAGFAVIRGVKPYVDGIADLVEGISVESTNRLKIQLEEALPLFPSLLTDSRLAIAREGLIGTGPFKIRS